MYVRCGDVYCRAALALACLFRRVLFLKSTHRVYTSQTTPHSPLLTGEQVGGALSPIAVRRLLLITTERSEHTMSAESNAAPDSCAAPDCIV